MDQRQLTSGQYQLREHELKLQMLEAIARSQAALASMLESVAQTARWSSGEAAKAVRLLESIERSERILVSKILSLRFRQKQYGRPGKAWISDKICKIWRDP